MQLFIVTLIVMLVMHYLGDFTHLLTKSMLASKENYKEHGVLGILYHAFTHGFLIGAAAYAMSANLSIGIMVFGLITISHFFIDFGKAYLSLKYPITKDMSKRQYWYVFGLDQLLHMIFIVMACAITV